MVGHSPVWTAGLFVPSSALAGNSAAAGLIEPTAAVAAGGIGLSS